MKKLKDTLNTWVIEESQILESLFTDEMVVYTENSKDGKVLDSFNASICKISLTENLLIQDQC